MVEKLKKIKHILIINNFNIKLMNDFYILFLKLWVSLSCFFFTKQKIKTLNLDNKNKIKILLDPKNGFVDKFIYTRRKWDEVNTKIIINNLKKNHCFVDVGSNTGYFSLLASPIVGKKGKIIAIEPIKKLYQQIKFNKKINFFENIKIYNFGCSNKCQKKEIYIRDDEIARSSLYKNYVSHYSFYKKEFFNKLFNFKKIYIRSEKIKLLKLDDFIKHKVDFIKIDIEGHEYQALQGMRKILRKYMPKLIIETNSFALKKNLLKKIFNFLSQFNYEIFCNNNLEKKINFNEFNKITKNEIIDIFCVNKNKKI